MKPKSSKIIAVFAAALLLLTAVYPGGALVQKADNVTSTYDFESIDNVTLTVISTYYDWATADYIRLRVVENQENYFTEVVSSYAAGWKSMDNYSLTVENLVDWVGPILQSLIIRGKWKLENNPAIWEVRFSAGVRGYREKVEIKLPPGYLSYVSPAPAERRVENNRETIVYKTEREILINVKYTDDPSMLLSAYVSEKLTGFHFLLVRLGTLILVGLGFVLIILVLFKRRARGKEKEFSPKHFPRLLRAAGLMNGFLLVAAGLAGLNILGAILIAIGVFILLFAVIPLRILPVLPKVKISLDLKSTKQLLGLFLTLNALWISAGFLSDGEFQRAIAFNFNAAIPLILACAGIIVMLSILYLGLGLVTPKRKRGFRTAAITKFSALAGKLGIAKPESTTKELKFGLLVALALAAVLLPIMYLVGPRGVIFGETIKQVTVLGALVLAVAAGFWEEVIFRGIMQPKFGLVLTSVFFGTIHGAYGFIPNAFLAMLAGLVLGLLYQRRGNIFAPIIAHTAFNLATLFILV